MTGHSALELLLRGDGGLAVRPSCLDHELLLVLAHNERLASESVNGSSRVQLERAVYESIVSVYFELLALLE